MNMKELVEALLAQDPDMPRLVTFFGQPCDSCTCEYAKLNESASHEDVAAVFRKRAAQCSKAMGSVYEQILTHQEIRVAAGLESDLAEHTESLPHFKSVGAGFDACRM